MVSAEFARMAVGIIGNVTTLVLFLSPGPTFIQIVKKGSVEEFSSVPYLVTFVKCGIWMLFGLPMVHPDNLLVLTINGTGFFIESVYLICFIIYSNRKQRNKLLLIILGQLVFIGVLAILTLTLAHTIKVRSNIVGSIADASTIIMYAAPLSVMKLVITTKSVEYMPFSLSLFSFLTSVTWIIYALIRFDPYIIVPNGLGSVLGIAQLVLYAIFYKSTKRQLAERNIANVDMGSAEMGQYAGSAKIDNVGQNDHP